MAVIAQGQKTLVDLNDPIQQGTAPSNPTEGVLWLDNSKSPPVLSRWSGIAWEIVSDAVIGGINQLLDTGGDWSGKYTGASDESLLLYPVSPYYSSQKKQGRLLTLSFDWATDANSGSFTPQWNASPYEFPVVNNSVTVTQSNQNGRCVLTWTGREGEDIGEYSYIAIRGDALTCTLTIKKAKLEFGNRATDWTSAPEDNDEQLELKLAEAHSNINTTATGIRQEVQANYAAASDMTRITQQLTTLSEQSETTLHGLLPRLRKSKTMPRLTKHRRARSLLKSRLI